jgi:hypothetical protein
MRGRKVFSEVIHFILCDFDMICTFKKNAQDHTISYKIFSQAFSISYFWKGRRELQFKKRHSDPLRLARQYQDRE